MARTVGPRVHVMHGPGGHNSHHDLGIYDPSIARSREGTKAVVISLVVLLACALAQFVVFALSDSVALLADLIHNSGDAMTAIPVGIAFMLRSRKAEAWAGVFVVLAIFVSAVFAGYQAVERVLNPSEPTHLGLVALAGFIGFAGNWIAAVIRTRAGESIGSAALIADGHHARADAWVSLGVVASAAVVAAGLGLADPLIGIAITVMILRITVQSLREVRADFRQLATETPEQQREDLIR